MSNEARGAPLLERAVFCLQDKFQEASLLEGRPSAIEALLAVVEFLSRISDPDDLRNQRPINSLISALVSLDDGVVLPMLKPAGPPGGSRNSISKEYSKALAVHTFDRLREIGVDQHEAYEQVADACRKAGMNAGRKGARNQSDGITDRTVRGWHETISADAGRHSRSGRYYCMISSLAQPLPSGTKPGAVLESLQRSLSDMGTA
jgi:hypothetical protein